MEKEYNVSGVTIVPWKAKIQAKSYSMAKVKALYMTDDKKTYDYKNKYGNEIKSITLK